VFGRTVVLTAERWEHICDRHGDEIGNHRQFELDIMNALANPKLVYLDTGTGYSAAEIFVECSKDQDYVNYVVLVAVKAPESSRPFVASAYLRSEVPEQGRLLANRRYGSPSMYPCGSPRAEIRERIGDRYADVLDTLRADLERDE
jgi:hypothetical protein